MTMLDKGALDVALRESINITGQAGSCRGYAMIDKDLGANSL